MNIEKIKVLSEIAGNVLVPISIALAGFFVTNAIKKEEIAASYVNTAIGILSQRENERPIRKWAVDVINQYSRIPMPTEVRESLIEGKSVVISGAPATLSWKGAAGSVIVGPDTKPTNQQSK